MFHNALGYAVELGLLPANPAGTVQWHAPKAAVAVSPQTVASPAQVQAILAQVALMRPDLVAFFACLYYAALRPEEALALRQSHLTLPARGRGAMILAGACPRIAAAWTSNGKPHEPRGLKHRPTGTVRIVPIPPILVCLLRQHIRESGTASDGRLFRGTRGGPLGESVYGRVWHAARQAALGPRPSSHPTGPPPLRPAPRSPVLVAERQQRAGRGRRPRGHQRARPGASMCIASAARKMSSASGSKTPLTPALAPRRNRHRWQQAVRRTAATTVGLSVICP